MRLRLVKRMSNGFPSMTRAFAGDMIRGLDNPP